MPKLITINRFFFVFLFILSSQNLFGSTNAISTNENLIAILEDSKIHIYSKDSTFSFINAVNIQEDEKFKTYFLKHNPSLSPARLNKKLQFAQYLNICFQNDMLLVFTMISNLDSTQAGWTNLILEYSKTLEFRQFYLMDQPQSNSFGRCQLYPRFDIKTNDKNQILLPIQVQASKDKTQTSRFAWFELNSDKHVIHYSKLAYNSDLPQIKTHQFSAKHSATISFPVNIPISLLDSTPIYFSYPFLVLYDYPIKKHVDFNHQFKYGIDSLQYCINFKSADGYIGSFTTINSRDLPVAYNVTENSIVFIVKNFDTSGSFAQVTYKDAKYSAKPLQFREPDSDYMIAYMDGTAYCIQYNGTNHVFKKLEI